MEGRRRLLFPQLSRETGRQVTKYVTVIDVAKVGAQHFGPEALHFMREMGNIFNDNYDAMIKSIYIINAPWFFHKVSRPRHPIISSQPTQMDMKGFPHLPEV